MFSNTISHRIEASLLQTEDTITLNGRLHSVSRIEWESPRMMRLRLFDKAERHYHIQRMCPFRIVTIR